MPYLHGDHLGSTSVTSGATSSAQTYYAFGAVRTMSGTLPTDYTFTGQKFDADAALMYYGARYYDATIGRFTQPDSIIPNQFNPQSLNRYAYVRNNPVRYTDPAGHFSCPDGWCMTEEEGIAAQTTTPPIPTGSIEPAGENQSCRGRCNVPDPPATTGNNKGPSSQLKPCVSPSGCIGANPNPPAHSDQTPDWWRFGIVSSFGYFAGAGPYYTTGSIDLVISVESGQAVVFLTTADPSYQCGGGILCSGDFTTPQVSVINPKLGVLSNLDHPTDYMGSFHDQVVTMVNITVEQIQSDRVSGILIGVSLGIPS
ncbi:MAG: RHS repeat-associated core domain-containing protein, partial [Chloroflexota bacterium]|nr:RHS repeat-associated core domain-containing protein [Chloroflexota bacterium]